MYGVPRLARLPIAHPEVGRRPERRVLLETVVRPGDSSLRAQSPKGGFCYSFGPRPPYAGYPDSPPRQGNGSKYRFTTLGPGVTPAVSIEATDPGDWDANDAVKAQKEQEVNGIVTGLGFAPSLCHS